MSTDLEPRITDEEVAALPLAEARADLLRRLVHVQSRHLAAAADVDEAWRTHDGRDVLLGRQLLVDVVRNLDRLAAAATDPQLIARARAAAVLLAP